MNIYVGHSTEFDFKKELYQPIRESLLNLHNIVLPHENSNEPFDSKSFLKECDLVIAEVTYKSTGLGIELGWASLLEVPIICVYKKNKKISSSLNVVSKDFIEYENEIDLINQIDLVMREKYKNIH